MVFRVPIINDRDLQDKRKLESAAHSIRVCQFKERFNTALFGAWRRPLPAMSNLFVKQAPLDEIEQETTFSILYQLDIGPSAAKTAVHHNKQDVAIGMASVELPNFIEYWKLFNTSECQQYNDKFNQWGESVDVQAEVFELTALANPHRIKCTKGLADVLLSSWLYGEDDLHCGNFGLSRMPDGQYRWARLDFGLSFASITNEHGRLIRDQYQDYDQITLSDLQNFPNLSDAHPFYWPTRQGLWNYLLNIKGYFYHNAYSPRDRALFSQLSEDSCFIEEKNRFLLRQFLTDIELKKQIIKDNIAAPKGARLASNFESRIKRLRWTALADPAFRAYVRRLQMDIDGLDDVFDEVKEHHQHALGKAIDIDNVQQRSAAAFSQLVKSVTAFDEATNQSNTLVEATSLDRAFIGYLAEVKENTALLSERLNHIHLMTDRQCALEPLNNLEAKGPFKALFRAIKQNWIMPHLPEMPSSVDVLFQKPLFLRLRNIEQLLVEFEQQNKLAQCHLRMSLLTNLANQQLAEDKVLTCLSELEHDLVSIKYSRYFESESSLFDSALITQQPLFSELNQAIEYAHQQTLKDFLTEQYQQGRSRADIDASDFIGDLNRLNILANQFFNGALASDIEQYPELTEILAIGHGRLQQLHEQFAMINGKTLADLAACQQQQYIQYLSFMLSRLALDIEREKMRVMADKSDGAFSEPMIEANYQLSRAMAKPSYHDSHGISKVAEAGLLAATAMRNPSLAAASSCARHVSLLKNSSQTRLATKVAMALAVVSLTTLTVSAMLLWGAVALPVISPLLTQVLVGTAATSTLSFFASSHYALNRYQNDKDKMQRYLQNFADEVRPELPALSSF